MNELCVLYLLLMAKWKEKVKKGLRNEVRRLFCGNHQKMSELELDRVNVLGKWRLILSQLPPSSLRLISTTVSLSSISLFMVFIASDAVIFLINLARAR